MLIVRREPEHTGAKVFNSYKFVFAKNRVIMEIVHRGSVEKHLEKSMIDIAGNAVNRAYALSLLRLGGAKSKYSAVAAVFARLSALYEQSPRNGLTADDWRVACQHALVRAGADLTEADVMVDHLIDMNRQIHSADLLQPVEPEKSR